ncbi:MAG TPA: ATPase, T2SS/T4P/T4SS family, partial [Thermoanaerobaculia bacterium]|nr:ATPase, T2SS/T4P/T4SS family [Thermoanaerobaculia bacterium]
MVLDVFRKVARADREALEVLKAHKWTSEAQKRELVERFRAMPGLEPEDVVWTAVDQANDIRAAGLEILKRRPEKIDETLEALVPMLRTRSEALRRAVQRFMKELGGAQLGPLLMKLCDARSELIRLSALELAREVPGDFSFPILKRLMSDPNARLRARALKAVAELEVPGVQAMVTGLAIPLLQDEDEEIRLSALAVLEKNPTEALISHVVTLAQSGGGRVVAAAFASLKRLLPTAQADHTPEILPLLADADVNVRNGALALLADVAAEVLAQRFVEHFSGALIWVRERMLHTLVTSIPAFVPAMLHVAEDRDADPAAAKAARELSLSVTDPRAVPVWLSLMEEPDWWVRQSAVECLGKFGGGREDVFRRLVAALKDPQLALSAVAALGDLGDARAAGPLFETFKTSQARPEDQNEILDAMAKLGAHEPRVGPILAKISSLPEVAMAVREKARDLVGKLQGEQARDALPTISANIQPVDLRSNPNPTIVDFLGDTVARGASDFHLATGFVPHRRVHGNLEPLEVPPVERDRAKKLIKDVLTEEQWSRLEKERHVDLCLEVQGLGRFRANFFSQRSGFDAAFRVIPAVIPRMESIGLPESAWEVTRYSQGLVLVTGPAGCGKSTTLAALVNRVNENVSGHIITIEDPIEFVHPSKECLVTQREVPKHTASFSRALRAALREDPDVIMVGEMRDLDTIGLA